MKEFEIAAKWWADCLRNRDFEQHGHPTHVMFAEYALERADPVPEHLIRRFERYLYLHLIDEARGGFFILELTETSVRQFLHMARIRVFDGILPRAAKMWVKPGLVQVKQSLWGETKVLWNGDIVGVVTKREYERRGQKPRLFNVPSSSGGPN